MASADTLCKKLLNVKHTVVESHDFYTGADSVAHLRIKARPNAWHQDDCPFCGRRCPGYDHPAKHRKIWRGLELGNRHFLPTGMPEEPKKDPKPSKMVSGL